MNYYSTNGASPLTDFREATISGQAPDKGLYFPERIPAVDKQLLNSMEEMSDAEIALEIIRPYAGNTIPPDELQRIVSETLNFPIPLVPVNGDIAALELFHGPTLAFKDVGARFMSRCLGYFLKNETKKVTVLVATSGDTGGAVASGFYGVEGVEVVILYPSGMVSPVQEKQLTTFDKNIRALEVQGSFDDCQQMVKQAFADTELKEKLFLTSANSINVARWLPQQFYYFLAYKQWADKDQPPVIAVPSGNFGNICAGMMAKASGLPVGHFIAACNVNDIVSAYLDTGLLQPRAAVPTLSNAMDVGNPSNFIRILEIVKHQVPLLKEQFSAVTVTDRETLDTIRSVYGQYGYLLDPHGAVGYKALQDYLSVHPGKKGIVLETAHPVKFPAAVEAVTGEPVALPVFLEELMRRPAQKETVKPYYSVLKDYLLRRA
ncbi:MAG TPA: threonine synthase [Chitinophagaceae bacterium]|nr:threonine synthase [Chitinophagaceae bacterium]